MMINVAICDDDKIFCQNLQKQLENYCKKMNLHVSFHTFTSGASLLFHLEDDINSLDIIFMDIVMNGPSGIETANKLRKLGYLSEIIFLTAHPEYVFQSFDSSPAYYLLKNSEDSSKLFKVFGMACHKIQKNTSSSIIIKHRSKVHRLIVSDIIYCEVVKHNINIFLRDGTYHTFRQTITKFEKTLFHSCFFRCHRSYIVNMNYISTIHHKHIELFDGTVLPLSASYKDGLKSTYLKYYSK